MADVFAERLGRSYDAPARARQRLPGRRSRVRVSKAQVEVPPERRFLGFDAYQKAIDCLKPGDVVLLTTPSAFRWVHFGYAIAKGVNVFMEKPTSVDGPSTRKMLALVETSLKKGLKVGVGLMCRHCKARWELLDRIQRGPDRRDQRPCEAYRLVGAAGASPARGRRPERIALPGRSAT